MQVNIRPFKPTDASELQRAVLSSVGHISPWLDWCTPRYSLNDARAWVAESMALWEQGRAFRWVMVAEGERQILGCVEVEVPTLEAPVGRMGYWVRRHAAGQGVCSQGAAQALDWALKSLGLERVELLIQPANEASIRVARKLGAEFLDQKHDEIVYRGEGRVANRYVVKSESSSWVYLVPVRLRWPTAPEHVGGTGEKPSVESADVYESKKSAKNARA